jgi:hypothetical protein
MCESRDVLSEQIKINSEYMHLSNTTSNIVYCIGLKEPEYCSQYSDWLRAERLRVRSSSPGRVRDFLSPRRPDRLWAPHNLLSNGYLGKAAGT